MVGRAVHKRTGTRYWPEGRVDRTRTPLTRRTRKEQVARTKRCRRGRPTGMAFTSVRSRRDSYASRSKLPTSWPLTPSNSQDSAESATDPHSTSPCNSTDGLIPIANDVRLSTLSSFLSARARRTSNGRLSVPSSEGDPAPSYGLRPARRLPPPLLLPTTPPPSPPRDFAVSSSALMSSAIVDDREEEKCPICLELLSLRLAGEKPHVVPVCGHRLRMSDGPAAFRGMSDAMPPSRLFVLRSGLRRRAASESANER